MNNILKKKKYLTNKNKEFKPTMKIVKKILFFWLKKKIKNSSCLDCFSGSGNLGINSILYNAKKVTFLEKNNIIIKKIKKKIKLLKFKNAEIIHTNTIHWLKKKGKPYNIIFLDPPFNKTLLQKTIFLLEKNNWIKNKSIIYIEKNTKNKNIIIPKNWFLYKKKILNNVSFYLYICKYYI